MATTAGSASGSPRPPTQRAPEASGPARAASGGRPRLLDRDDVVVAALALLDTRGYEALSMRRLASELLVSLPTVYAAIGSRSRLLVEVVRAALEPSPAGAAGPGASAEELQAVYEWFADRSWLMPAIRELGPGERRLLWSRPDEASCPRLGVLVHVVDLVARLVGDGLLEPEVAGASIAALLPVL